MGFCIELLWLLSFTFFNSLDFVYVLVLLALLSVTFITLVYFFPFLLINFDLSDTA